MIARRALVLIAVTAATACTRKDPHPPVTPDPAPSALASAPSASAPAALAPPAPSTPTPASDDPDEAQAWTDAPVALALAKDCKYTPPEGTDTQPNPLSCALEFDQSCVYDPCFEADQSTCKPKCKKACNGCAASCVTGCEACKKKCAAGDDACRAACGKSCGECRQACLTAKDHCTSGTCTEEYKACRRKLGETWRKSGCAKVCPAYNECFEKCVEKGDAEKCRESCKKTVGGACSPNFLVMCMMGSAPSPDE